MIILFYFLYLLYQIQSKKLVLMQQLFRHGARYPLYPFQNDFSNNTQKLHSWGQLTTQGKNMHYLLGQALFDDYWMKLFKGTQYQKNYNQSKVYVKSTDVNRTIESAQSQLMGWFSRLQPLKLKPSQIQYSKPAYPIKFSPQQQWNVYGSAGSAFHPIPVHVQKSGSNLLNSGDFLVRYGQLQCPNQLLWQDENFNSQIGLKIQSQQNVIEAMKLLSQTVATQVPFRQAFKYVDNYFCMKYENMPYLKIFQNEKYEKTYRYIKEVSLYLSLFYTQNQKKIGSSQFFDALFTRMKNIMNFDNQTQLILYSAHDTTVAGIIAALNMTNVQCIMDYYNNNVNNSQTCINNYPPFASNLIFQLWTDQKNSSDSYTIKILYNGIPRKLSFCDWSVQCSYKTFETWYLSFREDDIDKICGIYDSSWRYYAAMCIFGVMFILALLYIAYLKFGQLKRVQNVDEYAQNAQQKQIQIK